MNRNAASKYKFHAEVANFIENTQYCKVYLSENLKNKNQFEYNVSSLNQHHMKFHADFR